MTDTNGSTTNTENEQSKETPKKLSLLDLAISGAKNTKLEEKEVRRFIEYNGFLIQAFAGSIESTSCHCDVDQDEAMSILSHAEVIKFLSGLNVYLNDSV